MIVGATEMNLLVLPRQMGLVLYLSSSNRSEFTRYLKLTFPAESFCGCGHWPWL